MCHGKWKKACPLSYMPYVCVKRKRTANKSGPVQPWWILAQSWLSSRSSLAGLLLRPVSLHLFTQPLLFDQTGHPPRHWLVAVAGFVVQYYHNKSAQNVTFLPLTNCWPEASIFLVNVFYFEHCFHLLCFTPASGKVLWLWYGNLWIRSAVLLLVF